MLHAFVRIAKEDGLKALYNGYCVPNPLSPNSDQHQFSLNNIHMLPREMVMRVNKMITKEKCFDLLSNSQRNV